MRIHPLEYLREGFQQHPNRIAIEDSTGRISYQEAWQRSQAIGQAICNALNGAVGPIAIFLPKTAEGLCAFWGTLHSGNIYAPMDIKSPPERLAKICQRLQPVAAICNAKTRPLVPKGVHVLEIEELRAGTIEPTGPAPWEQAIDTDPAYIIHTSGSTGIPKGVAVSHRSIIDYIEWARETYKPTPETNFGSQSPFFFDNSVLDIYLSIACGGRLTLIPEELFMFPAKLWEYMTDKQVNAIFWVPSIMRNVAKTGMLGGDIKPPLKKILFAGEVMPPSLLNAWQKAYPEALFSNLYGPTEITVDCTYAIFKEPVDPKKPLPIGKPCRNTDVLILGENGKACQPNENGELCVRGSSLALGYWNDRERTQKVFCQNPLNTHYPEQIYRTGDIVYRNEEGDIFYIGRKDNQIKRHGYRIELGEIENALLKHEPIAHACVIFRTETQKLTAFLEMKEGEEVVDPRVLRKDMLEHLPKYMIPDHFETRDALPLTPNGKVDRKALETVRIEA